MYGWNCAPPGHLREGGDHDARLETKEADGGPGYQPEAAGGTAAPQADQQAPPKATAPAHGEEQAPRDPTRARGPPLAVTDWADCLVDETTGCFIRHLAGAVDERVGWEWFNHLRESLAWSPVTGRSRRVA